ncbi:sulfatase-like hydrolase/transferase [Brachybacterium vulturis]|uniref:sulfatase-like hydrolase/transferase n=1 Tax=Brachybacterium vulturis TaxID=2017484 RepID=UPI003735AB4B
MASVDPPGGETPPNILLLVTDDQGAWAMGSRMPELHTPALDRLQREGMSFETFFCASPVCSPARASLTSGRMPSAHGVHDWIRPEALARTGSPEPPFTPDFLDRATGADSLADMLSREGYRCGMVGKWHLGSSHRPAPGFDYWWAHQLGGGPYRDAPIWRHDPSSGRPVVPAEPTTEPEYLTDAISRQGLDALSHLAGEGAPFFLQVNWTAPHDPWFDGNHPEDLLALYEDTDFPSVPEAAAHPWFLPQNFPRAVADRHGALAGYCAAISGVDRSISVLLDDLEGRGLLEDTIIIFTSDNGFSCGHHGIWGKGNATAPLNFWEPSISVPFVVRWPDRIPPGVADARPASAVDLFPTIAELTGATPLEDPLRAGSSLAPRLRGAGDETAVESVAPIVIHDEYGANRMLRTERWKLVVRRDGPTELYDLREDPEEQHDLSQDRAHAALRHELRLELAEWFDRHQAHPLSGWRTEVDGTGQTAPVA